jgi:hypothetical protein
LENPVVLIKWADDSQRDLEALHALLARPGLSISVRRRIEEEIRTTKAGIEGEREAAYQIGFDFDRSKNWAVIHDLRIDVGGRVAQMDHLLINRLLDVWVCETKNFAEGLGVNRHGEWVGFNKGRPFAIQSPIEQNRRHISVLNDAFRQGLVQCPRRLGIVLRPAIHGLVLVSAKAVVRRPHPWFASRVEGLNSVIEVDQLTTTINRQIETGSTVDTLKSGARFITSKGLQEFSWRLAELHKPSEADWAARFGLDAAGPEHTPVAPTVRCAHCQIPVSVGVADYCQDHPGRFSGQILCWECQHESRPRPVAPPAENAALASPGSGGSGWEDERYMPPEKRDRLRAAREARARATDRRAYWTPDGVVEGKAPGAVAASDQAPAGAAPRTPHLPDPCVHGMERANCRYCAGPARFEPGASEGFGRRH